MPVNVKKPVRVPENADSWTLHKHWKSDDGKERRTKVKGVPNEDGSVPDQWPASEFTPANVLAVFGEGTFRVDFYDAQGKHIEGSGKLFDVANPPKHKQKLKPTTRGRPSNVMRGAEGDGDGDDDGDPIARVARRGGESLSMLDFMLMQREERKEQERREERLAERARQDSIAAQERDRQFLGTMLATMAQRGGAPAEDASLLRREMNVTIRESMSSLKRELLNALPEETDEPDAEPGNETPPEDMAEGASRIGMRMLQELEQRAPDLLNEAIPNIAKWFQSKGFKMSDELQGEINGAGAPVNGRAHRS